MPCLSEIYKRKRQIVASGAKIAKISCPNTRPENNNNNMGKDDDDNDDNKTLYSQVLKDLLREYE